MQSVVVIMLSVRIIFPLVPHILHVFVEGFVIILFAFFLILEMGLAEGGIIFNLLLRELIGHMNAKNLASSRLSDNGLAVFSGPHAYISPRWYKSGFNVPTWNYQAVHVRGKLRRLSPDENYLSLRRLVGTYENLDDDLFRGMFETSDVAGLSRGTTGFALSIVEIKGQFKLSQNKKPDDFAGAVEGLRGTGIASDAEVATAMEMFWSS